MAYTEKHPAGLYDTLPAAMQAVRRAGYRKMDSKVDGRTVWYRSGQWPCNWVELTFIYEAYGVWFVAGIVDDLDELREGSKAIRRIRARVTARLEA